MRKGSFLFLLKSLPGFFENIPAFSQSCVIAASSSCLTLAILLYMLMPPCSYWRDTFNYKGLFASRGSQKDRIFFAFCQVFFPCNSKTGPHVLCNPVFLNLMTLPKEVFG